MNDDDQPNLSSLERLTRNRIQALELRGLLDTHDGVSKLGGSRQDIWLEKSTGELWVARKNRPSWYERMYINPREEGVPGF